MQINPRNHEGLVWDFSLEKNRGEFIYQDPGQARSKAEASAEVLYYGPISREFISPMHIELKEVSRASFTGIDNHKFPSQIVFDEFNLESLPGSTYPWRLRRKDSAKGPDYVVKRGSRLSLEQAESKHPFKQQNKHCVNEFTGNLAYHALGVPVSSCCVIQYTFRIGVCEFDCVMLFRVYLQGRPFVEVKEDRSLVAQVRKGLVYDTLLGNYDVAGENYCNLLVTKESKVVRIDSGGTLSYSARGVARPLDDFDFWEVWDQMATQSEISRAALFEGQKRLAEVTLAKLEPKGIQASIDNLLKKIPKEPWLELVRTGMAAVVERIDCATC